MSEFSDVMTKIVNEVKADVNALETMVVSTAKDVAANIGSKTWAVVGDAVAAAEVAFEQPGTGAQKFDFAFSNAIAALEKDGLAFAEAEINYAIETFVQARNAALAA